MLILYKSRTGKVATIVPSGMLASSASRRSRLRLLKRIEDLGTAPYVTTPDELAVLVEVARMNGHRLLSWQVSKLSSCAPPAKPSIA